jgi:dTDP-glucose 4,6-dehydratase
MNTKIARIFNTYGPRMRQRDGRAVPNFISQALRNEDLTVYGDGSQTRSFCYITDLVDGIERLMHSEGNEPVNIGNPHEITVAELARQVITLTGAGSDVVHRDLPEGDPRVRRPDITRARTRLNWEPKVSLNNGLEQTIRYFRTKLNTSLK